MKDRNVLPKFGAKNRMSYKIFYVTSILILGFFFILLKIFFYLLSTILFLQSEAWTLADYSNQFLMHSGFKRLAILCRCTCREVEYSAWLLNFFISSSFNTAAQKFTPNGEVNILAWLVWTEFLQCPHFSNCHIPSLVTLAVFLLKCFFKNKVSPLHAYNNFLHYFF